MANNNQRSLAMALPLDAPRTSLVGGKRVAAAAAAMTDDGNAFDARRARLDAVRDLTSSSSSSSSSSFSRGAVDHATMTNDSSGELCLRLAQLQAELQFLARQQQDKLQTLAAVFDELQRRVTMSSL